MRNLLIVLALLFAAPVIAEAQGSNTPTGSLIYSDGSIIDGAQAELLFQLGSVDHQIADMALAILKCMEWTLQAETPDFTWEACRDEGIEVLELLIDDHEALSQELEELRNVVKS